MLQFISHHNERYGYLDGIRMALEGGCKWIQLRMKEASEDEFLACARKAAVLCREKEARFILDDHVELVKACAADGVHLGKNDMPVDEARKILGPDAIIGGTANTIDDIVRLAGQGADYIGCGPFRFTTTKAKLSPVLGLEGYMNICSDMRRLGIRLPIVAIGGIEYDDIEALMQTGIDGIALSGSILRADDPVSQMRRTLSALRRDGSRHTTLDRNTI